MSPARSVPWPALALTALVPMGCAANTLVQAPHLQPTAALVEPTSVDDSVLCRSLADHFIGLPTADRSWWNEGSETPAPSAGRWWVRQCSARARGSELDVELKGPGWYWVDQSSRGIRVRQQVPFDLSLSLRGRLREGVSDGLLSLWFVPSVEPTLQVQSPATLETETVNGWGGLLGLVPGLSVGQAAARRFNDELSRSFLAQARSGATFTYDLKSGQADSALGQLEPGKRPRHALSDDPTWLVNDRVLLAPKGSQVLGPIDPGVSTMNVIVEQGPGVTYQTICQRDLRDHYASVVQGSFSSVPASAWLGRGRVEGLGERITPLHLEGCRYYLVVTSVKSAYTLASFRVRA